MKKYFILIPVYNDWKSVFKLLENIDEQIKDWDADVSVLIVNDASTEERPKTELSPNNIRSVRVINMNKAITVDDYDNVPNSKGHWFLADEMQDKAEDRTVYSLEDDYDAPEII